jgi:hypothetical protein
MSWTLGSTMSQAARNFKLWFEYPIYLPCLFIPPVSPQSFDPAFADLSDGIFASCAAAMWCNCEASLPSSALLLA